MNIEFHRDSTVLNARPDSVTIPGMEQNNVNDFVSEAPGMTGFRDLAGVGRTGPAAETPLCLSGS